MKRKEFSGRNDFENEQILEMTRKELRKKAYKLTEK